MWRGLPHYLLDKDFDIENVQFIQMCKENDYVRYRLEPPDYRTFNLSFVGGKQFG